MFLVFLGAPGVGKGTVAAKLSAERGIPHISTGDIFRSHIRNKTELGKRVTAILDKGELVPDKLTIELISSRLKESDIAEHGGILDGFPRTVEQATALDGLISLKWAILFTLDNATIIERLSGRRIHPASGRVYHIKFNPPQAAGKDDITGEDLIQRPDDQEEAIRQRLAVYDEQTAPLVTFYRSGNRLREIDATPAPDIVFERVTALIDRLKGDT